MAKKKLDITTCEVGYGKPPKESQFKAGTSGNPKGRPKGSKNLHSIVLKGSRELVQVTGPRGSRKITKLEAVIAQIGNKAAKGDLPAGRVYLSMVQTAEVAFSHVESSQELLSENDHATMQTLFKRLKLQMSELTDDGGDKL